TTANVRPTSINPDFDLVERAKKALGSSGTTDTVHRALEQACAGRRLRASRSALRRRRRHRGASPRGLRARGALVELADPRAWTRRDLDSAVAEAFELLGALHPRRVMLADLLVAAAAEHAGIPVPHYDRTSSWSRRSPASR